jgi:hypothetical protein
MWMNEHDIDAAVQQWMDHPALTPAVLTLSNLRDWTNRNSDGWCYWPKPGRAAEKLQTLIQGVPDDRWGNQEREDATLDALKAALTPIKAFRTRCLKNGMTADFKIVESLDAERAERAAAKAAQAAVQIAYDARVQASTHLQNNHADEYAALVAHYTASHPLAG